MAEPKKKETKKKDKTAKCLIKKEYTEEEKARIASYKEKKRSTLKPIKFKKDRMEGDKVVISNVSEDADLSLATLAETTGTPHTLFGQVILKQAISASCGSKEEGLEISNSIAAAMLDIGPRDGLEGMLAAQMVSVHIQAMECLRRATLEGQPFDIATTYRNQAIKLLKTYAAQIEALKRYRTGGQQKVTVEHVHVHQGGQAIVGTVSQGGGGSDAKKGE